MTDVSVVLRRLRLASPSAALNALAESYAFNDNGTTRYPTYIADWSNGVFLTRPLDGSDFAVGDDEPTYIADWSNGFFATRPLHMSDYNVGSDEPVYVADWTNEFFGEK